MKKMVSSFERYDNALCYFENVKKKFNPFAFMDCEILVVKVKEFLKTWSFYDYLLEATSRILDRIIFESTRCQQELKFNEAYNSPHLLNKKLTFIHSKLTSYYEHGCLSFQLPT